VLHSEWEDRDRQNGQIVIGRTVSHYRIVEKLGEGGMGEVYRAHDERLDRPVALKVLRELGEGEDRRERFWREARAAARTNHPHVCQIYELGEDNGRPFLVMELLEGESLEALLRQRQLAPSESMQILAQMLSALGELHARGIVHRDLKPSNLFLTPHGVKLLDFGLARHLDAQHGALTMSGMLLGTPFYMAPEQALGQPVTPAADLFAAGVMLYEMLAGKRPFGGQSTPEILYAIVNEQPAALGGSPELDRLNTVISRALEKEPANRFPSAAEMAETLRGVASGISPATPMLLRTVTRLIVLPFRMLVPDPETEFLAFSLPDALASTLSQIESLVVRSSLVASRFAGENLDLKALASQAQVDAVLTGTLLRAGDQIRLATQLIAAPSGTLLHSIASQAPLRDLFRLQDELAHQVVESLSIRLSPRDDRRLKRDVPASPSAYEYYLRGNQCSYDWKSTVIARDLYLQCVERDPNYAPAWARLARCHRVLGKFGPETGENLQEAEEAFQRALRLNPDLSLAHSLYAYLEADLGRAQQAMQRLLGRARQNTNDAELFAGLTHVCRYCGLLNASVKAHERARSIDPQVPTSVAHTYFMMGDYQRSIDTGSGDIGYIEGLALLALGRNEQVARDLQALIASSGAHMHARIAQFLRLLLNFAKGQHAKALEEGGTMFSDFTDPEGRYYWVRHLSQMGELDRALSELPRVIAGGYFCASTLAADPWLAPLRTRREFDAIRRDAIERRNDALAAFRDSGGSELLGAEEAA
jgi:serine/threonine protein kinase/tetratricopeptide (TPR) repeat protein